MNGSRSHSWERIEPGLEPRALSPSLLLTHPLHTETPQTSHRYTPHFTPVVAMSGGIFEEGEEEGEEEQGSRRSRNLTLWLSCHMEKFPFPLVSSFRSFLSLSMVEQVIIDT